LRRSLWLFTSSLFFQNVWLVIAFFVMLLSNALTYLFQIYGLSKRF
jgi:predicted Zn-dependent protease